MAAGGRAARREHRLRAGARGRAAGAAAALGGERFADLFARGRSQPLRRACRLRAQRGRRPGTRPAGRPSGNAETDIGLPSQLTAREREIASLVAAGLSNRQIAERLFISRRTVDAHLEHIFGKLGITSRVMLAIQLREHSAEMAANGNA